MPRRSHPLYYWYLALVPLVALLAFIEFYPVAQAAYYSVTYGSAGVSNYSALFGDWSFWSAVGVSVAYALGSTLVCFALGMALAFLATMKVRGRGVFESVFIFPLAVSPIAVGVIWSPGGVWDDVQTFTHFILGLPYWNELSVLFYFPVMVFSEAWEWAPLIMLVGLSIVRSQSSKTYEAAELSGASDWQRFRLVALPSIVRSPVMQFVLMVRVVDALRAFEIPLAWSNWVGFQTLTGSPVDTLSLYLYKLIFVPVYGFPIGEVSAAGVVLLAVTLAASFVLLRTLGRIFGR